MHNYAFGNWLPDWVQFWLVNKFTTGLPTNFTLASLVEVVNLQEQVMQSDNIKCGSCFETDHSEVDAFCYKCKAFLCTICTKSHKNMRILLYHNCISVEELKSFWFVKIAH